MADDYVTSNLYSAAVLQAHGATLLRTTLTDRHRVDFVFANPDDNLCQIEMAYRRGDGEEMHPRKLFQALFKMRDELAAAQRQVAQ